MNKAAKKKPGRKPKGGRAYSVRLTDAVANYYRQLGGGVLTLGIERATGLAHKESDRA